MKDIIISAGASITLQYPSKDLPCGYPNDPFTNAHSKLMLCYFMIRSLTYVKATIKQVSMNGPSYFGDRKNERSCTTGGITLMDGVVPSIPDTVISVFTELEKAMPAITLCHKTAFQTLNAAVWDLPMRTFLSSTQNLMVLVYAYGGYIDLTAMRVDLRITTSDQFGLSVTCPLIKKSQVLQLGKQPKIDPSRLKEYMRDLCPESNYLYMNLMYAMISGSKLIITYIYCTTGHQTTIYTSIGSGPEYIVQYMPSESEESASVCRLYQHERSTSDRTFTLVYHVPFNTVCMSHTFHDVAFQMTTVASSKSGRKSKINTIDLPFTSWADVGHFQNMLLEFPSSCMYLKLSIAMRDPPCVNLEDSDFIMTSTDVSSDMDNFVRTYVSHRPCSDIPLITRMNRATYSLFTRNSVRQFWDAVYLSATAHMTQKNEGRKLGHIGLTIWVQVNQTNHCRLRCHGFQIVIAYRNPISQDHLLFSWELRQENTMLALANSGIGAWLTYINTYPKGNPECQNIDRSAICSLSLRPDDSLEQVTDETIETLSQEQEDVFADYHFFWGPMHQSWTEAANMCETRQLHLASISTEEEYNIVKGLLWGQGYRTGQTVSEDWILTPCRMESDVCFIYIGLNLNEVRFRGDC